MHLGFGFYRHMLNDEHYRFAAQCGCTHAVVHLCDYGLSAQTHDDQPIGGELGWGPATHPEVWTLNEISAIKHDLSRHGLVLHAIENFDPAQWHDILLDGPQRDAQLDLVKEQIRILGQAGVPMLGFNFSIAGVAARQKLTTRGGASTVGITSDNPVVHRPMPKGMVWNMVYDADAPEGTLESISEQQLWQRVEHFLRQVLPVAEQAGVILAAHPDDPPLATVRQQPRLVYRHHLFQKLLDLASSPALRLEFCIGTLAEMEDQDLYGCVEHYAAQQKIGYVHLRNVHGKVPDYHETFIDDGDVDIGRVIRILSDHDFQGVVIPDHTPQMSCSAPWHAGMAYALGYIKAKIDALQ